MAADGPDKHHKKRPRLGRTGAANLARVRRTVLRNRQLIPRYLLVVGGILGAVAAYLFAQGPSITPESEAEARFFQISTASPGGTYFPIGKTLASIISQPPGAEPCRDGGPCGVPGLIAVAKASRGSIANVRNVNSGKVDSALAQADVVAWAYGGERMFDREGYAINLRAIASLYPEAVQLVATRESGIEKVEDLRGKRISVGRQGSGTRADALLILKAYGIEQSDVTVIEVDALEASDMILRGALDAFFIIAGTPSLAVSDLMERGNVQLVPIDGPSSEKLMSENGFFVRHIIGPGTYPDTDSVNTVSVRALWVTHAGVSKKLVRKMTHALWSKDNRAALDRGHPKAVEIQLNTALKGIPIPLHRGARAAYRELKVTLPD